MPHGSDYNYNNNYRDYFSSQEQEKKPSGKPSSPVPPKSHERYRNEFKRASKAFSFRRPHSGGGVGLEEPDGDTDTASKDGRRAYADTAFMRSKPTRSRPRLTSYSSAKVQELVDLLVDDPAWWSCFSKPPPHLPSKTKSFEDDESGLFCCYVDNIVIDPAGTQVFLIQEDSKSGHRCRGNDNLVDKLLEIGVKQRSNATSAPAVKNLHIFAKSKKQQVKRLQVGSEKRGHLKNLRNYLNYLALRRSHALPMHLGRFMRVVAFLVGSVFKTLHLRLRNACLKSENLVGFRVSPSGSPGSLILNATLVGNNKIYSFDTKLLNQGSKASRNTLSKEKSSIT